MTNLSHWCVPRGSQRSTYSAPTMASAKLLSVRLSVAAIISPPGLTIEAQVATKDLTSVTCSTTSMASTTSKRSPCSASASAVRGTVIDRDAALLRHARCAAAIFSADGSAPTICAPSRASGSDRMPPPQPISSMRRPLRQSSFLASRSKSLRGLVADIGEPHRIELVQRRHRPARHPTSRRQVARIARPRLRRHDALLCFKAMA